MDYTQLAFGYNPSGDIITLVIAFVFITMIKEALFVASDYNFKLFKRALMFIIIAAMSNIVFYHITTLPTEHVILIYLFKGIYNVSLLMVINIFVLYINNLVDLKEKTFKLVSSLMEIIVMFAALLCLTTSLTQFGCYRTSDGLWADNLFVNPFSVAYLVSIAIIAIMLLLYRKKFIRQINKMFLTVIIISVIMIIVDKINYHNSYMAFSFMLPLLVVLVMIHSKPYDMVTGALGEDALEGFLEQISAKGAKLSLIAFELGVVTNKELSKELGNNLYRFCFDSFNKAMLFKIKEGLFVIVIDKDSSNKGALKKSTEEIDKELFHVFPEALKKEQISYKIQIYKNIDFITGVNHLVDVLNYRSGKLNVDEVFEANEEQLEEAKKLVVVVENLKDIDEKLNLDDSRVQTFCQPVKNVATKMYDTAETLMRLSLPEVGMVGPDLFVTLAEEKGYIHSLSLIMLNKTCKIIRKLIDDDVNIDIMSVNCSLKELKMPSFSSDVVRIMDDNGVPYNKIAFEVVEDIEDDDYNLIFATCKKLKKLGFKFYLASFGSGYTNYDRILSLDVDVIKFDRSLLQLTDRDINARVMLNHFASSFKELNYTILFVGVENEEHESLCLHAKADYLQGFLYAKPIPIEKYEEFAMR